MVSEATKIKALAKHLGVKTSVAKKHIEDGDYEVFTEREARAFAENMIEEVIFSHFSLKEFERITGIDRDRFEPLVAKEDSDAIVALIEKSVGMERFLDMGLDEHIRGSLLASYDSQEHEMDGFFIYRQN